MKQIVLIGSIFVAVFLSVATYTCDADWCLVFAWQKQEKMVRDNMLVGDYLRVHISELAPEKEVLGGTYYVTQLTFTENNSGEVSYEDGHVAHRASFTYAGKNGQVRIVRFEQME